MYLVCLGSCSVRDRLIESWNDTNQYFEQLQVKRVSYLSLEFLIGRAMQNALLNMDLEANYKTALTELGYVRESAVLGMSPNFDPFGYCGLQV